jgi:fluoride ion exporter CrcB/FEX
MSELRENAAAASSMLVASSVGCFVFGLLYLLGDKSKAANHLLSFYPPSGALSGVLIVGSIVWLICWGLLHRRWSAEPPSTTFAVKVATALLLASLLLTFPPFVRLL